MAKSVTPHDACPMALGINVLSGKWNLKILWNIHKEEKIRFNELQRRLGNITTRTLTAQLRELETQKIIQRTVFPETPPKVEYSFTETGRTLEPVLKSLCDWGIQYSHRVNGNSDILQSSKHNAGGDEK